MANPPPPRADWLPAQPRRTRPSCSLTRSLLPFSWPRAARQRCQPGGHGGPGQRQSQPGHRPGRHQPAPDPQRRARGQGRLRDDGGSLSLRNLVIDNGCVKAGDCPDARRQHPPGAAQLGSGACRIFGVEQPTLALDVTTGSGGGQQLAISLPDLATINDQLIASGLAGAAHPPAGGQRPVHRRQLDRPHRTARHHRPRAARSRSGVTEEAATPPRVQESCRRDSLRRRNQPVSDSRSRLAGRTSCSVPADMNTTRLPPVG